MCRLSVNKTASMTTPSRIPLARTARALRAVRTGVSGVTEAEPEADAESSERDTGDGYADGVLV
ncbi:hypothetical protein C446_02642 [Halobiforma nitratireducens JCM 10879]|uniref:Uncharacterized protein n=1 Tax=Halobiforma nitratireducens JCM 10879 TaxID=1227454 RepID=M0ML33_9EURY|nr:hypothetical protein C446_02642 [Halobiforma nitratireducens JCM 10879]